MKPIPLYVYRFNNRFHHVDGNEMGNAFHDKWRNRYSEFPSNKTDAIVATFAELSKYCAFHPNGNGTEVFVGTKKEKPAPASWAWPPRVPYQPRVETPTKEEMKIAVKMLFNLLPSLTDETMRKGGLQVAAWLRDKVEEAK